MHPGPAQPCRCPLLKKSLADAHGKQEHNYLILLALRTEAPNMYDKSLYHCSLFIFLDQCKVIRGKDIYLEYVTVSLANYSISFYHDVLQIKWSWMCGCFSL
jgi:hypothetical protein